MAMNLIATANLGDLFPRIATPRPLVVPSAVFSEFFAAELPALFPNEQLVFAAINRSTEPRVVLEFDTGKGFSNYIWSENAPATTRVVTIDLTPEARGDYSAKILRGDPPVGRVHEAAPGVGEIQQFLINPSAETPSEIRDLEGSVELPSSMAIMAMKE